MIIVILKDGSPLAAIEVQEHERNAALSIWMGPEPAREKGDPKWSHRPPDMVLAPGSWLAYMPEDSPAPELFEKFTAVSTPTSTVSP
jgi:hypothetical protein